MGAGVGVAILLLAYPIRYDLTPSALEVRSGLLFRKKIPLSNYLGGVPNEKSAQRTGVVARQVARQLRGRHGESFVLISPENKAEFMRELAARDMGLVMQGEQVVRIKQEL